MKIIRPVEIVTCCICGEQVDKLKAKEMFTGRTKYICPSCYTEANVQVDGRARRRAPKKRR